MTWLQSTDFPEPAFPRSQKTGGLSDHGVRHEEKVGFEISHSQDSGIWTSSSAAKSFVGGSDNPVNSASFSCCRLVVSEAVWETVTD
jgi:hypothetical protein